MKLMYHNQSPQLASHESLLEQVFSSKPQKNIEFKFLINDVCQKIVTFDGIFYLIFIS